jgi:hypothetical protein
MIKWLFGANSIWGFFIELMKKIAENIDENK